MCVAAVSLLLEIQRLGLPALEGVVLRKQLCLSGRSGRWGATLGREGVQEGNKVQQDDFSDCVLDRYSTKQNTIYKLGRRVQNTKA